MDQCYIDSRSERINGASATNDDPLKILDRSRSGGRNSSDIATLAPFNPSSDQIMSKVLDLLSLHIRHDDVLFDVGCGDGRLLIEAARRFPTLRCGGIEIDPLFVDRAKRSIEKLPHAVQSRITITKEDALQVLEEHKGSNSTTERSMITDPPTSLSLLRDATVLYLFIVPKGIAKLTPVLEALVESRRREGRHFCILSYMFKLHDWDPTTVDKSAKAGLPLYFYDFPPPNVRTKKDS